MSRKLLLSLLVIISNAFVFAQRIKGNLSLLKNQEIKLEGFNGTKTYLINTTTIDEKGDFELTETEFSIYHSGKTNVVKFDDGAGNSSFGTK